MVILQQFKKSFSIFVLLILLGTASVFSAYFTDVPLTVKQPDGTVLECLATGDEFYNWLHDSNGYTIIQDAVTGYFMYANLVNDDLIATKYRPGFDNPADKGLTPWLMLPEYKLRGARSKFEEPARPMIQKKDGEKLQATKNLGNMTNVSIFIRFSDESEFTTSPSVYDAAFNNDNNNSLKHFFKTISYNKLTINTEIFPKPAATIISYQDDLPRAYYRPYNVTTNPTGYKNDSERTYREHTLLKKTIEAVHDEIPADLVVDSDDDGVVDNVLFVVSGTPDAWASLLWPHKWALYTYDVRIHGKRVWEFNFNIQSMFNVSVICHEMNHTLGAPDLYRYYTSGSPVATWDLMANNTNPPQHTNAYMKWKYGKWIDEIPEIVESGVYTLNSLDKPTQNCFKIKSQYNTNEFFVVEYRRKNTYYETAIPGEGLLIYRINPAVNGNAGGPPDEIYIFRQNGTPTSWGNVYDATLSSTKNKHKFNHTTTTSYPFLTNGSAGGVNISNVSAIDNTISFRVNFWPAVSSLQTPANNEPATKIKPIFTWAKAKDADMYNFQMATDANFTNIIHSKDSIFGESYAYPNELPFMDTFYWRVRSITLYDDVSDWSSPHKFTVTPEPPQITAQSGSVIECMNNSVEISVSAVGRVVKIEWLKDGVVIPNQNKSILSYRDVKFSESAVYQARLTNFPGVDTVYSEPISVYIVRETKIVSQPQTFSAFEDDKIFLPFEVHINGEVNNSLISVQWYLDGKEIVDDNIFAGAKSNILSIKKINDAIFGKTFTFTVSGKCGTVNSAPFQIEKFDFTTIERNEVAYACENKDVIIFSNVEFENTIPGSYLQYEWYKDGNLLIEDSKFIGATNKDLQISNVSSPNDDGIYLCKVYLMPYSLVVENINIDFEVVPKFEIVKQPLPLYQIEVGNELILEVETKLGNPYFIKYQWFKDGIAIVGADSYSYKIAKTQLSDAGVYKCLINDMCNAVMTEETQVDITVKSSPSSVADINSKIKVFAYPNPASDYFDLELNVSENMNLIIEISDINGKLISTITNRFLEIGKYNFRIETENYVAGSYIVTIKNGNDIITQKLQILK